MRVAVTLAGGDAAKGRETKDARAGNGMQDTRDERSGSECERRTGGPSNPGSACCLFVSCDDGGPETRRLLQQRTPVLQQLVYENYALRMRQGRRGRWM